VFAKKQKARCIRVYNGQTSVYLFNYLLFGLLSVLFVLGECVLFLFVLQSLLVLDVVFPLCFFCCVRCLIVCRAGVCVLFCLLCCLVVCFVFV
jgi:hypothetical protein